ncbi:MAG: formylglycine-generating enzyme family protein [Candidatus Cryptobacteroides sp.]
MGKYSIFISYRRTDAGDKAEHLKDLLDVFYRGRISFDRENITGKFNSQLIERIDSVKDFILVLDKESLVYSDEAMSKETVSFYNELASLSSEDFSKRINELFLTTKIDYVRLEIVRALKRDDLNIIPVVPERSADYNFAELSLPADIAAIKGYEAVFYSDSPDSLFKDVVPKILKHLKTKRTRLASRILYSFSAFVLACILLVSFLWMSEKSRFEKCRIESDFLAFQDNSLFFKKSAEDSLVAFSELKGEGKTAIDDAAGTEKNSEIVVIWNDSCSLIQLRTLKSLINNMMLVPAGVFPMGAYSSEGLENPLRQVSVSTPFYISKFELTEREWSVIMNDLPEGGTDIPKTGISWIDAQNLISRLGYLTGLQFDLPSEEEWEYAAGYEDWNQWEYSGGDDPASVAVFRDNSNGHICNVGSKSPNRLEIYDMSGNVSEWCRDGNEFKKRIRGGSFRSSSEEISISYSDSYPLDKSSDHIGVRLILLK